ncbi:MAG: lecithin retinol acyltransferase family protein [Veillonellales bacterium]
MEVIAPNRPTQATIAREIRGLSVVPDLYGGGKVVQLSGEGKIEKVSFEQFTDSFYTVHREIWVPFNDTSNRYDAYEPIGSLDVAERALKMLNHEMDYDILFNNCHHFSCGCLSGNFGNYYNTLSNIKEQIEKYENGSNPVIWYRWNWVDGILMK